MFAMKTSKLVLPAALVVTGLAGFLAGRATHAPTPAVEAGESRGPAATRASRDSMKSAAESAAASRETRSGVRSATISPSRRLARIEEIVRGENPLERGQSLLAFLEQLGPGDFEEVVDHFRSLGITESRFGEYAMMLSAWAKNDPLAAIAYAKEHTGNRFAIDTILTTWSSLDPLAAIRWVESDHTGEGANPHMAGIIRGIAADDPDLATSLLTSMPRSRERGEALDALLPHLLAQGDDATRAWIAGLSDDALRNGAMMRVADRLAAGDPAGTVAWLLENPSEATQRRMDDVYSTWVRNDPQAAQASLATLPAGDVRSNALRGLVSGLAASDPSMAVSLMDRNSGDVNDRVVQSFIWNSFWTHPATAVGQIGRITNEGHQNHLYRRLLDQWMERDPNSAQSWIRSNTLPAPVLEHLQRRAGERP
jgi:hypothetical protein